MATPSFVYFTTDADRTIRMGITKDLQVELMLDQERAGTILCLVRVEEFETLLAAMARLKALTRMNLARRRKVIASKNPDWRPIPIQPHVLVTPAGSFYRNEPYLESGDDPGDASGGVTARMPAPIGPRIVGNAKKTPTQPDNP